LSARQKRLPIFSDDGILCFVVKPEDSSALVEATKGSRQWRVSTAWFSPEYFIWSEVQ
jgi:hypothetical protein